MRRTCLLLIAFLALPASAGSGVSGPPVPRSLDDMFTALQRAKDEPAARELEREILTRFRRSGSPAADLLFIRATMADSTGDPATALKLARALTALAPGFAEGWRLQGLVLRELGDSDGAIAALRRAVTLNPRHFAAYAELSELQKRHGDATGAAASAQRARTLDPHLSGLRP